MNFGKNAFLFFIDKIVFLPLALFINVLISRQLGPELKGAYSFIIQNVMLLITFFNLGIGHANIYFAGKEKNNIKFIFGNSLFITLILTILTSVIFNIYSGMGKFIGYKEYYNFPLFNLRIYIILFLLLFSSYFESLFYGINQLKYIVIINIVKRIVNAILIILIYLVNEFTINNLLTIFMIVNSFSLIQIVILLKKYKIGCNLFFFKKQINYGFKSFLGGIADYVNYKFDILLIAFFLNSFQVGIYVLAVELSSFINDFSKIVQMSLKIQLVNIHDKSKALIMTISISKINFLINFIVISIIMLISSEIIFILYKENYALSIIPFNILLSTIIFRSYTSNYAVFLQSINKNIITMKNSILSMFLNIGLNILLIPKIGIIGAAFASLISYTIPDFICVLYVRKKFSLKFYDLFLINNNDIAIIKYNWRKVWRKLR